MSAISTRAVFLSYASQDSEAARRIAEALRAVGLEVWFDQDELRGGDVWDRKIKNQIRSCALFVPIISANTQARPEGYFRLEWHLAEQRSLLIAKGRPFIVPVCIDETRDGDALVPDAFLAVQWSRPADAAKLGQFADHIQRLLTSGASAAMSGGSPRTAPAVRAPMPDQPVIPDFELVRQIGHGSYGDVWLARGATGLWRAIKIVWRDRFADAEPFEREWRGLKEFAAISLGEASHLALLHVGRNEAAGFFYYVMELADDAERGRAIDPATYRPLTFAELRRQRNRLPADECVRHGQEVARTLSRLHARGLVHRDIKPSNIILVNGVPKLADIGLVAPASSARTFVGTEGYVPPDGPGSPGADVFALGKVLYELATGNDRQDFPQLPADLARLPDRATFLALNEVILRACEPSPAKRYRDAAALLSGLDVLAARRAGRGTGRRGLGFVAATAVLLVVLFGLRSFGSKRVAEPASAPAAGKPSRLNPAGVQQVTLDAATRGATQARGAQVAETADPAPTPAPAASAALATAKSIAVLPFENLSEDKESGYFANGLHGEVLSTLAQVADLRVISRTSMMRFRDSKQSPAEIARELGVTYLLEGSVQRSQDRVRLSGRLVRVSGEELIWAGNFVRSMADVFALQSELSQAIVQKLEAAISPREQALLAQAPTKNAEAYRLFLQAIDLWERQFIYGDGRELQETFEKVVKLDPDFTRAWAELAKLYIGRQFLGSAGGAEHQEKIRVAVDQCLRLAPDAAETQAILGYYYYEIRHDYAKGMEYFERAVQLAPNIPDHHVGVAMILRRQGKWIESTAKLRHAAELDPQSIDPLRYLAMNLTYMRRYTEALQLNARIEQLRPELPKDPWLTANAAFNRSGSTQEGDALIAALSAEERASPAGLARRHAWALRKGDFAEAIRLDRLISAASTSARERAAYTVDNALVIAATGDLPAARARLRDMPEFMRARLEQEGRGVGGATNWAQLAQMEALRGHRAAVLECAERAAALYPEKDDAIWGPPISLVIASARAWLGDKDFAIAELQRLLRAPLHGASVFDIRNGPHFFPLRGDPRFEAVINDPRNREPIL